MTTAMIILAMCLSGSAIAWRLLSMGSAYDKSMGLEAEESENE